MYDIDLGFPKSETQHATHALHPYVAAMNPSLARTLLEHYVPPEGVVLDPFVGGGCVAVEAVLSGRKVIGGDVNPLSVLVSRAKTTWLPKDLTQEAFMSAEMQARQIAGNMTPGIPPSLAFWFHRHSLPDLAALAAVINERPDDDVRTLLQAVLSATVRDVMLTYRGEIRLRKLNGDDLTRFNPDVFVSFRRRADLAIERVGELPREDLARIDVADVRRLPFASSSISAIVCSPPYADDTNGVGYYQFSRNMLVWLGLDEEDLLDFKTSFLGGRLADICPLDVPSLRDAFVEVGRRNERHLMQAKAFYGDYFQGLREMLRVVQDRVVIVIGNRVLSRTLFDNANITIDLMDELGAKLEDYFTRTFAKKRIANLGTDGGGTNVEHILVFAKH